MIRALIAAAATGAALIAMTPVDDVDLVSCGHHHEQHGAERHKEHHEGHHEDKPHRPHEEREHHGGSGHHEGHPHERPHEHHEPLHCEEPGHHHDWFGRGGHALRHAKHWF